MEKHIMLGLLIPAVFLVFAGLIRSLVRKRLAWSNFYLGLEVVLAALANALVNICERAHELEFPQQYGSDPSYGDQMTYSAVFLAAGVGILLILMVIHQRWEYIEDEKYTARKRLWRGIWLGLISNFIAGSLMVAFIVLRLKRLL